MSLADVLGQPRAVNMLKKAAMKERLSHSWLFVGPAGCGKRLLAKEFAKLINCQDPKKSEDGIDCCDQCLSCKKIDNLNHPDIEWFEPEGKIATIKIEKIRSLQRSISLKSYEAKWKVYTILEADCMRDEAANALLKTLEEPPAGAILILTTSNINKLLPTIVSRCQIVALSALSFQERTGLLKKELGIGQEEAAYLNYLSESVNTDSLKEEEGLLEHKNEIIEQFNSGFSKADAEPDVYRMRRDELDLALAMALWWYRDMLVYKEGGDTSPIANVDRQADIKNGCAKISTKKLSSIIKSIIDARALLQRNVNPKLVLSKLFIEGTCKL